MDSSYMAPPQLTGHAFSFSQKAQTENFQKPAALPYEPSAEEDEVLRVGLFIDILNYEFRQHKGFASSDWTSLYKYWLKHIFKAEFWSARKEIKKINVKKLVQEGVLTVDTQKRLYGESPWYPEIIEDEREKTIEWLKVLDPEDVQYTLYSFFEGGLKEIREMCMKKQKFSKNNQSFARVPKENPVIIREQMYLEVVIAMHLEQMGFKTRDCAVLAKAAMKFKNNPKLEGEIFKHLKLSNKLNAESPEDSSRVVRNHIFQFSRLDEEDFGISFNQYFQELDKSNAQLKSDPIAKKVWRI